MNVVGVPMRTSIKSVAFRVATASIIVVTLGASAVGVASAGSLSHGSSSSHDHNHDHDGDNHFSALTVTAITPTLVSVAGSDNFAGSYSLTPTTTYFEGTQSTTFASLALGEHVHVTTSATTPTTAVSVNIELAKVEGKVTAISGDTLTISSSRGAIHPVVVGPATTYSQNGSSTTLASVVVGSEIEASGVADVTGTTLNAVRVEVAPVEMRVVKFDGKVGAVSPTLLTLALSNTSTQSFVLSASTTVSEGPLAATTGSLSVGEKVVVSAEQTETSPSTMPGTPLTASSVRIVLATLRGTVTAVSSGVITISSDQGFNHTILVDSATQYRVGSTNGTLASVVVGSSIVAQGNVDTNLTSLDAVLVLVQVATSHGPSSNGLPSSQHLTSNHPQGHAHGGSTRGGGRH